MIYVIKNTLPLGILTQSSEGVITFEYLDFVPKEQYLGSLSKKINTSDVLFPIFENMIPEHDQKILLESQYEITNSIDILLHLENVHGTYEFYSQEEFEAYRPLESFEKFVYNEKIDEILDNNYEFPNILKDYELNISNETLYPEGITKGKVIGLSGFQYKFSILINKEDKTITHDSGKLSNYFMKPYNRHYSHYDYKDKDRSYIPYLLINEHLFMTLARDFGFKVPYNGIIKHEIDYHYFIKRFDRYNDSKIDHTELLTLMNKISTEKYKVTMQEVFETAKEYLNHGEEIILFKFIIFSVVIGHGDLHAKNLSLINVSNKSTEENKQLSPFYDISTTKIYKGLIDRDIGLKIINKTKNIDRQILLKFADIIKIDKDIAINLINEVYSQFKDTFLMYVEKLPNEIKGLVFHHGKYSKGTLDAVLRKYYNNRLEFIEKNLLEKTTTKKDSESVFWE